MAILVIVFIFASCVKEAKVGPAGMDGQNGVSDKQIRFEMGVIFSPGDTVISTLENSPCGIHQFNINNYEGVDSAVFVIYNITTSIGCCGGPDTIHPAQIVLYDLKNNTPIANSEIVTDDVRTYVVSKNFASNLPKETIDIGIRVITGRGIFTQTGNVYMFLYRK